jgi:3,4-dihydroxy-2-butanone 4-phosphate synthase
VSPAPATPMMAFAERFGSGEPVLIGGDGQVGAFVALTAADVRPARLRRLGELAGELAVLALDEGLADRIGVSSSGTSIDAAACRDGGWSLADRALTIRLACAPDARRSDLVSPGHVSTMRVDPLSQTGLAAVLELARAAGQPPAAVICPVLDRAGGPVSLPVARQAPHLRALTVAPEAELHSRALARALEFRAVACELPTAAGVFEAIGFAAAGDGDLTIALVHGDPTRAPAVPVHVHTACLFGDVFASADCNCRGDLETATAAITAAGAGVILYSKPAAADPFSCPRWRTVDPSVAAGLLRHLGIASLTLTRADRTLADELTGLGFELGEVRRVAA